MNVQLFIPCFIDQLYPQTAFNMVKVLEKVGCTVSYNAEQTPAATTGLQCRFSKGGQGSMHEILKRLQRR